VEIEELVVEKQTVETELANIKQAIKEGYISKRTALARDLMAVYGHLKHGGKIVDVFEAFRKVGLDKEGNPKLAIVSFDARTCYLYKKRNGGAIFSKENKDRWQFHAVKGIGDVELPPDTYEWNTEEDRTIIGGTRFKSGVPIVPPRIVSIASAKLTPQHYHVIYEPELWAISRVPSPPRDPILVKRLTPNIFGVVATWDLTKLEQAIIRGRSK